MYEDIKKDFEDLKKDFVIMNELILKDYKEFNRRILTLEKTIIRPRPNNITTGFPPGVGALKIVGMGPNAAYNPNQPDFFTHDLKDPYVTIKKSKISDIIDLLKSEATIPYHILMAIQEFLREAGIE